MKRRNADLSKLRRPLKRAKIGDGVYGSTFAYLKMILLWCAVLTCDFLFELRFEYFWPFWMFSRSVYDSFRYQGMAFSLLFVLLTLTSDMACYIFIPVHWLFFAAGTYVWVQYVWHAERGICLPTISLWILFIYIEASLRLKDEKHLFFHADLSRPFAAHCIGYPVVTLGFSVKSYIGHRLRLRRQKVVASQNGLLFDLLFESLPPDCAVLECVDKRAALDGSVDDGSGTSSSAAACLQAVDGSPPLKRSPDDARAKCRLHNGNISGEVEFIENRRGSINEYDESEDKEKNYKNSSQTHRPARWTSGSNGSAGCTSTTTSTSSAAGRDRKSKAKESSHQQQGSTSTTPGLTNGATALSASPPVKDDNVLKLELDVKRLRAELNSTRQSEQELRSQVSSLVKQERNARDQLHQLQQDDDQLQTKLHNLVTGRQQDRQSISALERKLADEKRCRQAADSQLQLEKKKAAELSQKTSSESKARLREAEAETRQLRRENKQYEDRVRTTECELKNVRELRESQTEAEVLMSALTVMQEKNQYLEKSLSSETRIKMDLFAALGDVKRELEINKNLLLAKEREVGELNSKLADVLSVSALSPCVVTSASAAAPSPGVIGSGANSNSLSLNGFPRPSMEPYPGASADLFDHHQHRGALGLLQHHHHHQQLHQGLKTCNNGAGAVGDAAGGKSQLDPNAASYTPKMA